MYIEEYGYHALDNVYAVKGSTATRKTDSLFLPYQRSNIRCFIGFPHSKQAVLFTFHRVIPQLRPVLLLSYLPRSTRGHALPLVVSSLEAKIIV